MSDFPLELILNQTGTLRVDVIKAQSQRHCT